MEEMGLLLPWELLHKPDLTQGSQIAPSLSAAVSRKLCFFFS